MARYTGPKNKLSRKIGEDLGLKTNALKTARRVTIRPGQHGAKGRRKLSDYGVQLKEKQKAKYIYGIMEKQILKLYKEATKNPTATGSALLTLLERRLDNALYRSGMAPTRAAARQMVAHSHLQVNGRKMNIPSYQVKVGDVITIKSKAAQIPFTAEAIKENRKPNVEWIEVKGPVLRIARLPERKDVKENIDEQMIVEFYSK